MKSRLAAISLGYQRPKTRPRVGTKNPARSSDINSLTRGGTKTRAGQEHVRYTHEHFTAGKVLLYGPVMAPDGAFGMGVLEVADEAEARQFIEGDPTVRAGLNKFELYPTRVAGTRAKET